jgi:deoxycytidine triphosphate deaminase
MILSDREIQDAIKKNQIIIDPIPQPQQYTTSAVDLCLGDELFELKTIAELQQDEPAGMERDATVNLLTVDVKDLYRKYAKPITS